MIEEKNIMFPSAKDFQSKPFDVDTTFEDVQNLRKHRVKPLRGPDSPLYAAIWPMFSIIKIFGLAPYEFTGYCLAPSNLCLVFSFIFMALYCYIMYIIYMRFAAVKRETTVLGGTENAKVILNFLVAMHNTISVMFTRETFVKIWNNLQDYDENVRQLGYPRKETRVFVISWMILLINIFIWTSVNQIGMYAFFETWAYNMGYITVYLGTCVSVYKFAGTCYLLGQRFEHLKEIAKQNAPCKFNTKVSLKTIERLHNDLMLTGETLNSLYTGSIILWLANLCMHSVSNAYFLTQWILEFVVSWPLISCLFMWLMGYLLQLLVLHIVCDYTTKEANSIGAVMVEWQARLIALGHEPDCTQTSLHLLNRKLCFSAGGCFDVDLQLLRSIVAIFTTYLVILLQFPF